MVVRSCFWFPTILDEIGGRDRTGCDYVLSLVGTTSTASVATAITTTTHGLDVDLDCGKLVLRSEAWEVVVRAVHIPAVGDYFGKGNPDSESFIDVALIDDPVVLVDGFLDGGEVLLELD